MRFTTSVPAPSDQNSLAAYERQGGLALPLDTSTLWNPAPQQTVYGPEPGPLLTGNQPAPTPRPSFWQNTGKFLQSDAFANLVGTGINVYGSYQQQKDAKAEANLAQQRAANEAALAQAQMAAAQAQQQAALEASRLQSGGGGLPPWAIPAGLAAAGLLVVLLVTKKK